jgi:hypothetical protein
MTKLHAWMATRPASALVEEEEGPLCRWRDPLFYVNAARIALQLQTGRFHPKTVLMQRSPFDPASYSVAQLSVSEPASPLSLWRPNDGKSTSRQRTRHRRTVTAPIQVVMVVVVVVVVGAQPLSTVFHSTRFRMGIHRSNDPRRVRRRSCR